MFVSKTLLGKNFGNLAYVRGIVSHRISQHEQKPFAKAIAKGIINFIPRTTATVVTWLPVFVCAILVHEGVEAGYKQKLRKNPSDYINEVNPLAE